MGFPLRSLLVEKGFAVERQLVAESTARSSLGDLTEAYVHDSYMLCSMAVVTALRP